MFNVRFVYQYVYIRGLQTFLSEGYVSYYIIAGGLDTGPALSRCSCIGPRAMVFG